MAQYQPFLISDFKTGKFIGLEPWLLPQDAFPTLINARVNKGVLEKRYGMSVYAQMKHGSTLQTTTAITGIKTYLKKGMPQLLVMDTKRVNRYNPVDGTMTDIAGSDIFTGRAIDFFHFANWLGVGYMVNNVDQIYQYNGQDNVSVFNYQIDSTDAKTNHLDTCRFIFTIDDRFCFLDTVEFGAWYPNRFRYSPVLSTDGTAAGAGYVDCPIDERICAAGIVNNQIIVFMEGAVGGSVWRIKSTGNSDIPYEWERIKNNEMCNAPYSGVEFKDGLGVVGLTSILFYDGFEIKGLDIPNIRDVLDEFSTALIRYTYGYYQKEKGRILWTFAVLGGTVPNRILEYNIIENNWTVHKSEQTFFVNCIGGFNNQKVPTWLEADDVYTGADGALMSAMDIDSREILGSPYPVTLVGCRNSRVYKWDNGSYDGTDDTSGKIELDIQSAKWNPFVKEGKKASLEKIQFYVDHDVNASFTVSFYKDMDTTAWRERVVSCNLTEGKPFITVYADGEVGNFHKIKISHTEKANRPRIHAIMPFFAPETSVDF